MLRHHDFGVRLVDPIGEGGSGVVWRAWDVRERRYVAAKVVASGQPVDRTRLRHPHVLTTDRWCEDAGSHLGLMRLVRGGTADRLLASHGALPAAYVAVLLDQLLQALGALHDAGLVHRDVKPANLLLEPTGTGRPYLWLGDLGVATPVGRRPTTTAATPGYVAPEVLPGTAPDPRHDVYAAGVTATELLTGHIPRDHRDVPRGPLGVLLRDLTDPDLEHRPAGAAEARGRLTVPTDEPWRRDPHPPNVPDRLRRLSLLERVRVQGLRAAQ